MPDRKPSAAEFDRSPSSHSIYPPRHPPPPQPPRPFLDFPPGYVHPPQHHPFQAPYPELASPYRSHSGHGSPQDTQKNNHQRPPPPPSSHSPYATQDPPAAPAQHQPPPRPHHHAVVNQNQRAWALDDSRQPLRSPGTPTQPGASSNPRRPSQQQHPPSQQQHPPSQQQQQPQPQQQPPQPQPQRSTNPSPAGTRPPSHHNEYPGPSPPHHLPGPVHESRQPPPASPREPTQPPSMAAHHEYYNHPEPPPPAGHHVASHPYPPHPHGPPPPHVEYQHGPPHPGPFEYHYPPHGPDPRSLPRRHVRATQACEECRKKKSKCDETRPQCNTCQAAGIECHYREVQPPKQERSIIQVLQAIDEFKATQQEFSDKFQAYLDSVRKDGIPGSIGQAAMNGHNSTPVHAWNVFPGHYEQTPEHANNHTPSTQNEDVKPTINGSMSQPRRSADVGEVIDILNGEQSMPKSHTTAAHKLVNYPFIKEFFSGVDPDYIKLDAYRGTINLYDRASSFRLDTINAPGGSPGAASTTSDSVLSKPAHQRDPLHRFPEPGYHVHNLQHGSSELKPGQVPSIGYAHANHLVTTYLRRIHGMQPFVDIDQVKRSMQAQFVPTTNEEARSTPYSASGSPSDDGGYDMSGPASKKRKGSGGSVPMVYRSGVSELRNPDRTIETAVMLLVFALGDICDHKSNLHAPLEHIDEWLSVQSALAQSESSNVSRQIGPHVPSTARSFNTPRMDHRKPMTHSLARTSSADGPSTPPVAHAPPVDPHSRNLDLVPGLAFYAYAVGILGEQLGGETLPHVQAALLAGLYMGQLARVHESYSWIHRGGTAMQGLLKRSHDAYIKDKPMGGHHNAKVKATEYTIRSYWACHQLESDILAELDNPSSGITSEEDRISILFTPRDDDEAEILQHYNSMIEIRKILNRVHSSLYLDSESGRLSKSGWINLKAVDLNQQLEQWRSALPPQMQWKDDDPNLTHSVNDARLRGKYYGCKYIINRPYLLDRLLHPNKGHSLSVDSGVVEDAAKMCVKAAQDSTVAFDGIHDDSQRLILTNVFGTAHAQFGNMLVLAAVMRSPDQSLHLAPHAWTHLIDRSVRLFQRLAPLSPALTGDMLILQDVQRKVRDHLNSLGVHIKQPQSTNSSFSDPQAYPSSAPPY